MSVFPLASDLQSAGTELSRILNAAVFSFVVEENDVFKYALFVNGDLIDQYNSWPAYPDSQNTLPDGGTAAAVLPYCIVGTTGDAISKVLLSRGKGLESGLNGGTGLLSIKNQLVRSSSWWARPFVWTAMTAMEWRKKNQPATATVIWPGIRLATAFATLLDIPAERVNSGYGAIKDGSAALGRGRTLSHVMSAADYVEDESSSSFEEEVGAKERGLKFVALESRPAYADLLQLAKKLLDGPREQDNFKKLCLDNGMYFSKKTIDMKGLGPSPVWWNFAFKSEQSLHSQFQIAAVPKKGLVQCASCELTVFDHLDGASRDTSGSIIDGEFDYALHQANLALSTPQLDGRDVGENKYAIWRGKTSCLFLYQSPALKEGVAERRRSIGLWWEPWSASADNPAVTGTVGDWLAIRHESLF